ncbi:adenylate/guanylate cyclase domain-containing protein [Aphanizomenon flos-aquae NRERC-008]|jgi:adenylate cyclase|uniref:Adenylate/guanylate cyclase domain-containing protein n=1 Tax=Aphanizomenon flos-aquae FACHB-1249 TaxID=2692889 RepID=A0ABR8IV51_APHFL|nr:MULTISPECIES: adenylate/guanylate cyclase domain-containing protein [Aphanizomenon]MCE2905766.1 adenylate/guanylate cyclase domain-containing protein [Anabaena sp. CoA2_C59]MDJ0505173.1 adenylate/guanylate cyclase domain-containing protein [Nostocales cyanobacterium LE14-WE12]MBD2391635.1 adenylate/guanylate cyclase domain-containing protein [Aphanizomenon flos-aquae FACHB-1171]MBD2558547.1 adenylate/guanylate cyclase domain-containing protein [Aphanizomenon flos-aquae FACHB-1290]MBD2630479
MRAEKLKNFLWQGRGLWSTTPVIAFTVILIRSAGLLQGWEWGLFDQYMRWRPPEPRDNRIVIVGIDEKDLDNLKQPTITDQVLADLLNKLKARKPRAIGLDVYRNLPLPPGTSKLEQVFKSTPNLVGIQKVVGKNRYERVDPPPILKSLEQVGANDLVVDADSKVRRGLMYISTEGGEPVYSFSLHLALRYLKQEGISASKDFQLGKTKFIPFESNDGGYVHADDGGYQILINYRGKNSHFDTVSMTDIIEDKVPTNWGKDRIILIGYIGESLKDSFFTPYSSGLLGLATQMSGIEIHANLTSQIISAALENRYLFKTWSEPQEWVWILFWSGVGAFWSWSLRLQTFQRIAFIVMAAGALLGSTYLAFLWGWWLPVVPPFLALISSVIAITAYIARTAGDIRKVFGRYLTDEVVANLLESPEGLKLGGERRQITIFTSDLRGFTATSERLPPEEVVKILNFYLECMADEITKYQGTIDEFMGDGILVLFGAPTARDDDAARAVACGIAMQLAMVKVNAKMQEWGLPPLEMGIGINTGVVVVGNIGSEKRTKYGIVGSQVNLTYRIEGYTTGGEIIISESTFQKVESIVVIDSQMQVTPKGVQQPINVYKIAGVAGEYNLFLSQYQEELCTLPEPIPIEYSLVDGKDISSLSVKGMLVRLATKEAEIRFVNEELQEAPASLSNIKLNLCTPNQPGETGDIYAKVTEKPAQIGHFCIRFTAKPPEITTKFSTLIEQINSQSSQ